MFRVYELAVTLTGSLQLEARPLERLPLAVCNLHMSEATYAFPSATTGRWLLNQRATEASMFMAHWLVKHHRSSLCPDLCHALCTSLQFAQTLLRCLRPSLPTMQVF
jgi:hypothetical protein